MCIRCGRLLCIWNIVLNVQQAFPPFTPQGLSTCYGHLHDRIYKALFFLYFLLSFFTFYQIFSYFT